MHDLRELWLTARDAAQAEGRSGAALEENAALRLQLEEAELKLKQLGKDQGEALAAAQAERRWAEAEVARAKAARQSMLQLSQQVQEMFMLCEVRSVGVRQRL